MAQAARGLGALSPGVAHLFPLRPQRAPPVGCLLLAFVQRSWPLAVTLPAGSRILRNSLDRNRGPVCSVGGGGFSGAEFAPFPTPLPPTSSGDGLALLWSFSVPLFCELLAVCSGRLVFSLAIPQFKRAPYHCSQGLPAGPYPKQCCLLLSVCPHLLVAGAGLWGTFLLRVAFRHVICGPYLIFPPS